VTMKSGAPHSIRFGSIVAATPWPQCGPARVALPDRYFKEKDTVENYLAKQVRDGKMDLSSAQKGIAEDWTQYLNGALRSCPGGNC